MTITIYHNPQSGTSRNVLAIIRISGERVVDASGQLLESNNDKGASQ